MKLLVGRGRERWRRNTISAQVDARRTGIGTMMPTAEGAAPRVLLGLSCDYHDSAAALIVEGRIAAAVEQERISRIKHDSALPEAAVESCLDITGLTVDDIDEVVFYEKPLTLASRFLATRQRQGPRGLRAFMQSTPQLLGRNLFIGTRIAASLRRLGRDAPCPIGFVEHHRSHAAAAFYPSPFGHAAVLTIDGLGEWATATIGQGSHRRIDIVEEQRFPNSLGLVYSLVTAWCGFTANCDEYKVMGLAPYGAPRFLDALEGLAPVDSSGGIAVDGAALRWFAQSALRSTDLARRLGGPPRHPEDELTDRDADLAASVQAYTDRAVMAMAVRAHEVTGERNLVLAGGVALNAVANGRLTRDGPFDRVWIQPAAGDAGSAIGAALTRWHDELGHSRTPALPDSMSGALLGPDVDDDLLPAALRRLSVAFDEEPEPQRRADRAAQQIADGGVVAWFQGRAEFGPRALGSRSFLADPRDPLVRGRLNELVKGRESFRPFAPAVLEEAAGDWFDLAGESPYMVVVAPVRSEHLVEIAEEPSGLAARAGIARSTIPACTHVDGSARVQTVSAERHPDLRRVIESFDRLTGCPILVNTSFNRAGEPIVNTVEQALHSAAVAGVELLVIGPAIIDREALRSYLDGLAT